MTYIALLVSFSCLLVAVILDSPGDKHITADSAVQLSRLLFCTFSLIAHAGRTGRVGNLGKATSFVDPEGDGDVMPKLVDMLTKVASSMVKCLNS